MDADVLELLSGEMARWLNVGLSEDGKSIRGSNRSCVVLWGGWRCVGMGEDDHRWKGVLATMSPLTLFCAFMSVHVVCGT